MKSVHWLLAALSACLSLPAPAAQAIPSPRPDEAAAPAPALQHDSVLLQYRPDGERRGTPDQAWRAANADMERLGGHAGHLQPAAQAGRAATAAPAAGDGMRAKAVLPAADGHAGHH